MVHSIPSARLGDDTSCCLFAGQESYRVFVLGIASSSSDMGLFFDANVHLFKRALGWDGSIYARTGGERVLRCIGSIKGTVMGSSTAVDCRLLVPDLPVTDMLRVYTVQCLTGKETAILLPVVQSDDVQRNQLSLHDTEKTVQTPALHGFSTSLNCDILFKGIQEIVGVGFGEWPRSLRTLFMSEHLTYSCRFKLVLFLLHHGVDPRNVWLWITLRPCLHDQSARQHVSQLFQYFLGRPSWGKSYTTYCLLARKEVNIRSPCAHHTHLC